MKEISLSNNDLKGKVDAVRAVIDFSRNGYNLVVWYDHSRGGYAKLKHRKNANIMELKWDSLALSFFKNNRPVKRITYSCLTHYGAQSDASI